jgi:hypothetical protein
MRKFLSSFWWCLANALVCLWLLAIQLEAGDTLWTWAMVGLIIYWAWAGKRALNTKRDDNVPLTPEQLAKIQAATDELHATMKEIDLELKIAAREEANVQSDRRKDQEAGSEGTDGRTDSKEDR